jgi:uroporphyrinogen III methyltransferase/synthase
MATGKVYLVGAGPGDPGLISLRAVECLQRADVVLYDGLVNPLVLQHAHVRCERTCRSSSPDGRILKQDEINERLVEAAKAGNTVVRLKGGDPFIFGRGSEEAAYLRKHGIEYEIVPGITAAVAAGEYAGLSLTHRDHASMVTFVTGHESPDKSDSALDYDLLAKLPGTLVFYMGLHRLPKIAASLIGHGKSASTPTAVISRATTPLQRTVTASLAEIADEVASAQLIAPSLIIVGECVRQRDELAWFEQRPLFGLRIGITRPEAQAAPQISRAIELGAQPVLMPLIDIRVTTDTGPLDAALERLDEFDWLVFTSANGVDAFFKRLWDTGRDARSLGKIRCAAIGPSTADALAEFRVRADLVPDEYRAEALAAALVPQVAGKRILWPRANRGRDVLPNELTAAGATVEQVVVYENVDSVALPANVLTAIESEQLDWIALSSPSIARSFAEKLPDELRSKLGTTTKLATISPVTSQAATEADLPVSAEATTFTWDGIFDAIQKAVGP